MFIHDPRIALEKTSLQMVLQHYPVGTPEYCAERLATTMERTGLRHVIVVLETAADQQCSRESIERFAVEVLERLRR